jgi:hypothetical protein
VPNDDNEAYLLEHQRNEARILGGEQVRHCTVLLTSLSCLALKMLAVAYLVTASLYIGRYLPED